MSGTRGTTRGERQIALGRAGEDLAVARLEAEGMVILARNVRCARGEIDIIARDGAAVVFVEVFKKHSVPSTPETAVKLFPLCNVFEL